MAHSCKKANKRILNRRNRRILKNTNVTSLVKRFNQLGKGYVFGFKYGPNKRSYPEIEE